MRLLAVFFLLASCLAAADLAGAWIITSVDNNGTPTKGELLLKEEAGVFSAKMKAASGVDIPLQNVRRDGDKVAFQFPYEGTTITINLALDGDKLKGKWEAPSGESAPVTCTRAAQPAGSGAPVTGKWTLTATRPGGSDITASIELKEQDGKLSGSLSTDQVANLPLAEVSASGSSLSFKIPMDAGAFLLKFEKEGEGYKGTYTSPDGATGAVTLKR
jgi:hypothetical protein